MNIRLDALEARVLGCLVEKEITTPDQYPLSLNALVNACNQKSNRDPVLALDEATVQATLDGLGRRHLVLERSGFGSRVLKYRHRLCNGDHNPLQLAPRELAVLCELLLRGPQTPGELKARVQRLAPFADADEVEATLAALAARPDGPFVVRLPRQIGARDARWAQLFTGEPAAAHGLADAPARDATQAVAAVGVGGTRARAVAASSGAGAGAAAGSSAALSDATVAALNARIETLEHGLAALRAELATLKVARS